MDELIQTGDRLRTAAQEALAVLEGQRVRDMHTQAVMASLRSALRGWEITATKAAQKKPAA